MVSGYDIIDTVDTMSENEVCSVADRTVCWCRAGQRPRLGSTTTTTVAVAECSVGFVVGEYIGDVWTTPVAIGRIRRKFRLLLKCWKFNRHHSFHTANISQLENNSITFSWHAPLPFPLHTYFHTELNEKKCKVVRIKKVNDGNNIKPDISLNRSMVWDEKFTGDFS